MTFFVPSSAWHRTIIEIMQPPARYEVHSKSDLPRRSSSGGRTLLPRLARTSSQEVELDAFLSIRFSSGAEP